MTTDRDRARTSPIGLAALATQNMAEPYRAAPHHALLNTLFVLAVRAALNPSMRSNFRRQIWLIPSRMGKSMICSVYGPAWALAISRSLNIAVAGYGEEFVETFSRQSRETIEKLGPSVFGVDVDPRSAALNRWGIADAANAKQTFPAAYHAFGIGGPAMGRGFNLIVVDDPIKSAAEALSSTILMGHKNWFDTTMRSRIAPGASIIIAQQSWVPGDLPHVLMQTEGTLLDGSGPWLPVIMPLEAEPIGLAHGVGLNVPDPLNRPIGQELWPGRYSPDEIREKKINAIVWQGQSQQRPSLIAGSNAVFTENLFDTTYSAYGPEAFRLNVRGGLPETVARASLRLIITTDIAASVSQRADFSTYMLWGIIGTSNRIMLLDVLHQRLDAVRAGQVLESWVETHRPSAVWIETTGMQLAVAQTLTGRGLPVRAFQSRSFGDKYVRASRAADKMAAGAGEVFLPDRAPWLRDLKQEMLSFPLGTDDQVDAFSQACIVANMNPPLDIRIVSGR